MSALSRVLAVDDDPDVVSMLRLALLDLGGLEAEVVSSPQAFLAALPARAPQLVLVDRWLEDADGLALIDRLRADHPELAPVVVLLTAADDPETRRGAEARGVAAVMKKPFSPLELAGQLAEVYAGAEARPGP